MLEATSLLFAASAHIVPWRPGQWAAQRQNERENEGPSAQNARDGHPATSDGILFSIAKQVCGGNCR
jgi:hypothetical protein